MPAHRHITRFTRAHHGQDSYLVRVSRYGRKFAKYFPLRSYPTEQAALEAALAYRDQAYSLLGIGGEAALTAALTAAESLPPADRATLAKTLIDTLTNSNS